jgi:hypothetical protein
MSNSKENMMVSLVPLNWIVICFGIYMIYFYEFSGPAEAVVAFDKLTGIVPQLAMWVLFAINLAFTFSYKLPSLRKSVAVVPGVVVSLIVLFSTLFYMQSALWSVVTLLAISLPIGRAIYRKLIGQVPIKSF